MWGITAKPKNRPLFFSGRYQYKIAISYIVVILIMLVVLNTYPILTSRNFVYRSKQNSMQKQALLIASTLAGLDKLSAEHVGEIMSMLDDQGLARMMVTDAAGLVLYDTALTDNAAGRYVLYREIYAALNEKDGFWSKFSQRTFQSKAAVPVMSRGMVIGAVYLYEYDTVQGPLLLSFQSQVANLSVGVATAVLLISLIVSSVLTRRMGGLLRAIRLAREGEYSHPAPVKGKDELAELAKEFNQLTTRIQRTDEVRRQFVSDASHELKTPLSSMRLLADSILLTEDMPLSEVREFVGDIGDEIDRLSRMTEKLMLLTRLDAKIAVDVRRVAPAPLILRARHMLGALARQARVSIQCELDEDEACAVTANQDDIYQIVFNLMENAIKYNRPGGRVSVYLFGDGGTVTIHVDDTGAGIPEADVPRLFERFYRVDKTRARLAGGAGLGLSIVRDIVERYGGSISIKSELDKGSRFTVAFPASAPENAPSGAGEGA